MTDELLNKKVEILKAISQPTRIKILELLKNGEMCTCKMIPMLGEKQANISKQLTIMRHAGLVEFRKEGVSLYYKISHMEVFKIIELADEILKKELIKTNAMIKTYSEDKNDATQHR